MSPLDFDALKIDADLARIGKAGPEALQRLAEAAVSIGDLLAAKEAEHSGHLHKIEDEHRWALQDAEDRASDAERQLTNTALQAMEGVGYAFLAGQLEEQLERGREDLDAVQAWSSHLEEELKASRADVVRLLRAVERARAQLGALWQHDAAEDLRRELVPSKASVEVANG